MEKPTVSIIISAYNVTQFIGTTINSVLRCVPLSSLQSRPRQLSLSSLSYVEQPTQVPENSGTESIAELLCEPLFRSNIFHMRFSIPNSFTVSTFAQPIVAEIDSKGTQYVHSTWTDFKVGVEGKLELVKKAGVYGASQIVNKRVAGSDEP